MSQPSQPFHCDYSSSCSGCGWFAKPYSDQKTLKVESFVKAWEQAGLPILDFKPRFVSVAEAGLRDRVDLVIDNRSGNQRLGMFDQEYKEIVDLPNCPQLTKPLQTWLDEFRKIKWPIQRGSVRLRVSPHGDRGVWLDFANADVKLLLDEKSIFENLLTKSFVEVGQRRKRLVQGNDRLRLVDPVLQPWFQTFVGEELTPTPLLCHIGGFTQTGFQANRALIVEVFNMTRSLTAQRVAEFGSGVGNFTLPLASQFARVDAFEVDGLACQALTENLMRANLDAKVTIHRGDFQNLNERRTFNGSDFDLIFVDPPRSGLKQFLDPLFASQEIAKNFLYVSCYPDSFCVDAKRLYELGYTLRKIAIVDQFPQTPHAEIVAFFSL